MTSRMAGSSSTTRTCLAGIAGHRRGAWAAQRLKRPPSACSAGSSRRYAACAGPTRVSLPSGRWPGRPAGRRRRPRGARGKASTLLAASLALSPARLCRRLDRRRAPSRSPRSPRRPASTPPRSRSASGSSTTCRLSGDASRRLRLVPRPRPRRRRRARRPPGHDGRPLDFNAPTVFNAALNFRLNWRGNFRDLEEQNEAVLLDPRLMGPTGGAARAAARRPRLCAAASAGLRRRARAREDVLDALATFQRSLLTPDARFDRYLARRARRAHARASSAATSCSRPTAASPATRAATSAATCSSASASSRDPRRARPRAADLGRFTITGQRGGPPRLPRAEPAQRRADRALFPRRPRRHARRRRSRSWAAASSAWTCREEDIDLIVRVPAHPDRRVPGPAAGRRRGAMTTRRAGVARARSLAGLAARADLPAAARRRARRRAARAHARRAAATLILSDAALQRDVLRARAGLLAQLRSAGPLRRRAARRRRGRLRDRRGIADGAHRRRDRPAPRRRSRRRSRAQEDSVEAFKSQNALLQNSLAYFATLSDRLGGGGSPGEPDGGGALANAMLRFAGGRRAEAAPRGSPRALDRLAARRPAAPRRTTGALVLHGRLIVGHPADRGRGSSPACSPRRSRERARAVQEAYLDFHGRARRGPPRSASCSTPRRWCCVAYLGYLFLRLRANARACGRGSPSRA